MKIALIVVLAIIALAILLPLIHLLAAVLVVAGGIIVVMAAWKILFGAPAVKHGSGGPPAVS